MKSQPLFRALSFDDIQLIDSFSESRSRNDISLDIVANPKAPKDKQVTLKLPIISAAMSMIESPGLAYTLISKGGCYCIHRYLSVDERIQFFKDALGPCDRNSYQYAAAAVGLKDSYEDLIKMYRNGIKWFVFDIAACNNISTIEFINDRIRPLKAVYDDVIFYVGNFSSVEFLFVLDQCKLFKFVDGVKVSQGGSKVCSTRINTGVGIPTLHSIFHCSEWLEENPNSEIKKTLIIGDGGINTSGDMAKSFAAGASLVMLGGLLAGYDDSTEPWNTSEVDEEKYYHVYGMASEKAKRKAGMPTKNIEGISTLKPMKKGDLSSFLEHTKENIQSSLSLQGFSNLSCSVGHKRFCQVFAGGINEAKTY